MHTHTHAHNGTQTGLADTNFSLIRVACRQNGMSRSGNSVTVVNARRAVALRVSDVNIVVGKGVIVGHVTSVLSVITS